MARNVRRGSSRNSSGSRGGERAGGVLEIARDRPIAAAAVAAGAAAAGLFLWSRRSQISNQLSNISEQIGEWTESGGAFGSDDDTAGLAVSGSLGSRRNRAMSESAGGNAGLEATSGRVDSAVSASGRGRTRSTAASQE